MADSLILAIPFYKNAGLVSPLLSSLARCGADLTALKATILLIVDSPDDEGLISELRQHSVLLASSCKVELLINPTNIGFVKSINLAFRRALSEHRDIIILNSDVEVFEGTLLEMRSVAYSDPMIAFVNPRSNNATICTTPKAPEYRRLSAGASFEAYRRLKPMFKPITYTPTAVGFAMYIKWIILNEFGLFDPIYGLGYNEENDLVMRANRCGYRAAIANHAFIYHIGEESFGVSGHGRAERDAISYRILKERYPEYERALKMHLESNEFASEVLLDGLLPDVNGRLNIAFDLTNLGPSHNGTFEAARNIVEAVTRCGRTDFLFFAICTREAFDFHHLDLILGLERMDPSDCTPIAALIRIGQPFNYEALVWSRKRAPVLAIMMLDTIALDCAYINEPGLKALWQIALDASDIALFNSHYSLNQFRARFRFSASTRFIPLLHSTAVEDYHRSSYCHLVRGPHQAEPYVLVVGNKYSHKFLKETAAEIQSSARQKRTIILGLEGPATETMHYVPSGALAEEEIQSLFAYCSVVLFPSHYEGFGFPILHALAHSKPIVARDIPVFQEIRSQCDEQHNIHLYDSTQEMVNAAFSEAITWQHSPRIPRASCTWQDTGRQLLAAVQSAVANTKQDIIEQKLFVARSEASSPVYKSMLGAVLRFAKNNQNQEIKRLLLSGATEESIQREFLAASPLFDQEYYQTTYNDVAEAGVDCLSHFMQLGWREMRNPSAFFNTKWYLEKYVDVQNADINPLLHFLVYGIYEGRTIRSLGGEEACADI